MWVSLPVLTETCFEVNMLGQFAPDRSVCSVGEGIEGGGCTVFAAPATSYSRALIEYMTADAWSNVWGFLAYILFLSRPTSTNENRKQLNLATVMATCLH